MVIYFEGPWMKMDITSAFAGQVADLEGLKELHLDQNRTSDQRSGVFDVLYSV